MEYIERTQRQAEESAAKLEAQAEELRQQMDEARQALEECTEEKAGVERQLEDMTLRYNHAKNNWDAQSEAKESFRQDVAQRDRTVRELTEENQRLFHQIQELEGQLEGMRRDKERIAQLELDAHQRSDELMAQTEARTQDLISQAEARAEEVLAKAEAEAASLRKEAEEQAEATEGQAHFRAQKLLREMEEKIGSTAEEYDKLFQSVDTIAGHITSELRKLDVTAAQLPISFNHLKEGLADLQARAKERS